jgi:cysteinyl-tRNA synthetase
VLSLDLLGGEKKESSDEEAEFVQYVEQMIALRAAAKKEKNFAEADRIRGELLAKGIKLIDTREGTTWTKELE